MHPVNAGPTSHIFSSVVSSHLRPSTLQFVFIRQQAALIKAGEAVYFPPSNVPLSSIQYDWTVVTQSGEAQSNQW